MCSGLLEQWPTTTVTRSAAGDNEGLSSTSITASMVIIEVSIASSATVATTLVVGKSVA